MLAESRRPVWLSPGIQPLGGETFSAVLIGSEAYPAFCSMRRGLSGG